MKPAVRLWWMMHRSLVHPDIYAVLNSAQRKWIHAQAMKADQRTMFSRGRIWFTVPLFVALIAFAFGGGAHWISHWSRQWLGPLGPFVSFAALLVVPICGAWMLTRDVFAKSIFRSLRQNGFDVCAECGYWLRDLDASTTKCPECGATREKPTVTFEPDEDKPA